MAIAKVIRKFESFEDMRLAHIAGWQVLDSATRFSEAWNLVVQYRQLKNLHPFEPRLQRTVTVVRRAQR
jgi:hypothetical protein